MPLKGGVSATPERIMKRRKTSDTAIRIVPAGPKAPATEVSSLSQPSELWKAPEFAKGRIMTITITHLARFRVVMSVIDSGIFYLHVGIMIVIRAIELYVRFRMICSLEQNAVLG